MTKKDRQLIFDKYLGRCAYCGCELKKGWHVSKLVYESSEIDATGNLVTPNDTFENKIPSCAKCNMSRSRDNGGVRFASIEDFRKEIIHDLEFLKSFPYYQRVLRFGMIIETKIELVFHFEKQNKVNN